MLALVGLSQPLARVLAHRFQEPVAHIVAVHVGDDERLLDQLAEHVEKYLAMQVRRTADGVDGVQAPAAGEGREPSQQHAFRLAQQVVAPVDGSAKRLLAPWGGPAACRQQSEAVVQVRGDLSRAEQRGARRGQLARQRHAVEPAARLTYRRRVLGGQRERRQRTRRPLDEQARRWRALDLGQRPMLGRLGERWHA
jgi:hypothetical protein